VVRRSGDRWQASVVGRTADVFIGRDSVQFDFPTGGTFIGHFSRDRQTVVGQWTQARLRITGNRFSSPVVLTACSQRADCFRGTIEPLDDQFSFYLQVKPRPNGKLGAFIRNPEANQGRFYGVDNVVRRGDSVLFRDARDTVATVGFLRNGAIRVVLRGGATYDLERVPPDSVTFF